ncbi:MAG: DUF3343 domain-containing protein [Chloroflexi bacterium]|nr:DUF3343 domain-containing protein [Chloroflexota bacterium]
MAREELNGLISFFASYHAIRADRVLRQAGYEALLVPGPRELSPNCGTALRFPYGQRSEVLALLTTRKVQIEAIHEYRPATQSVAQIASNSATPKRHWVGRLFG